MCSFFVPFIQEQRCILFCGQKHELSLGLGGKMKKKRGKGREGQEGREKREGERGKRKGKRGEGKRKEGRGKGKKTHTPVQE